MTQIRDFNGRAVREGDKAQLVTDSWDGPQYTVQEIDAATGRAYLTGDSFEGWVRISGIV